MGQTILVLGNSGTGKTTSLRNFKSNEITLIRTIAKALPFKGQFDDMVITDSYTKVIDTIQKSKKKVIVIDDFQYIMSNEFFRRAKETGWDKYNDIGSNIYKILHAADNLPDDVFVYILTHTQIDENGIEKIKTIGKMIDEKLTVEGLCTVVLKSIVTDGVYSFQTQNSGHDTCKSPVGMFENYLIDNDLKMVDSIIREYWGYSTNVVEEKGVAKDAPSLIQPKVRPTKEAKERKLTEAPVITNINTEKVEEKLVSKPQSKESLVKEAQGFSEPVVEVKEEKQVQVEETQKLNKIEELKRKIELAKKSNEQANNIETVHTETSQKVEKSKADIFREKLAFLKTQRG